MELYIATENLPPIFTPAKRDWTIPENNQRNIPWSELELPEGFPQLSESVASVEDNGRWCHIDWGEASPWEAVEMAAKFCENGSELTDQFCEIVSGRMGWDFLDDFGDVGITFDVSSSTHMGKTKKEINLKMSFKLKE